MDEFSKQVVWVTGAASGLGRALVSRFLRDWEDCRVVATDRRLQALQSTATEEHWDRERILLLEQDVTQAGDWGRCERAVQDRFQGYSILINNAGVMHAEFLESTSAQTLDSHLEVNFRGVVLGTQHAAIQLAGRGGGRILNIASLAGIAPIPGIAVYSATKFAVRGFSIASAEELRAKKIFVTAICPDAIRTPMVSGVRHAEASALVFSAPRLLDVSEVVDGIFHRALVRKPPVEVMIPRWRGGMAKFATVLPGLAAKLVPLFWKIGSRHRSDSED